MLYETLLVDYLYMHLYFQSLLYEIINGLRAAGTDAGSSSAATASFTNGGCGTVASLPQWLYLISWSNHFLLIDFVLIVSATKSVVELLTERVNQLSVKNDNDLVSQSLPALPLLLEIFNSTRVQDFLLDENHNLTEMDGNTGECHLEVEEDIA